MKFRQLRLNILLLCLLAALAAAFAFSAPTQAQDDSYVDLSIEISVASSFNFTARNRGTATAYGVTVDIEIADQTIHSSSDGFEQKSGTTCSKNISGTTCINGVWTVGTLEPGEQTSRFIIPRLASGLTCCPNVSTKWSVPARAVVKNTFPTEEERFKGDNTAVGWIWVSHDGTNTEAAVGRYWLEASVDDLLPDAGGTVKFNFKVSRISGTELDDAKVRLKLDNGMGTPTATPPSGTSFAAVTSLTRTWDWNIGTSTGSALEVSTTLANPLPTGVDRSDLCLTADLTARPDNLGVIGRDTHTSAEICFREDPVILLHSGETDLHSLYHCVGVTDYPCSSSDTLELLVDGNDAAFASGISRADSILMPEKVVVQVPDPAGRVVDGSDLSWQTISDQGDEHTTYCSAVEEGVLLADNWDHMIDAGKDSDGVSTHWTNATPKVTATGANGGTKPGTLIIQNATCDFELGDADTGVFLSPSYPVGGASGWTTIKVVYIFGELGTYLAERSFKATHNNGTTNDTTDDVEYTATGTYTFHVGPIADLEVRDGGANPGVESTQRAFTIMAVNNGPDAAPAVQVTITDLSADDYVSHSATAGSFDSSTGVWTIGEMRERGYYQDIYGRDGEVITIITTAAVDTEITAEIENNQDYQVCIDSDGDDVVLSSPSETACTNEDATNTWHTAKYYDYISDNDSATIKAKDGTGANLPSLQSAEAKTAAIVVTWNEVTEVNGRPVTHYKVDRETNPWETVAEKVIGTTYVDTDVEPGATHRYRVRAVNDWEQEGPWSPPMEGTAADAEPEVITETITRTVTETVYESEEVPVGLQATPQGETEIALQWDAMASFKGSQVAHYRVEVSAGAERDWSTLADELTVAAYDHTGLSAGDTRLYRVFATNVNGEESGPSGVASAVTSSTVTETVTETVTRTVTETVYESEDPYAYFAEEEFTRTVAENSAPGSPVGAPVAVLRNSGNKVAYSLEGPDAALFTIEQDSGQILVGEGTLLDYESGATSYTVEVVADPSSGADVKATVTISVVDVSETGFVFIDPAGVPQVGFPLFASLMHTEGEPIEPRWQWQRSMPDGAWADIPGAIQDIYIPTELDAGRRLRALVVFGNPRGDGEGLAGAVTERVPGEVQVIPTAGTGATPEEVFGVLGHNLAAVWLYDNATQTWAVYSPWNPPEVNDLKTVSSNDVVWMDVISEVQFQGKTLYPGWNLVIVN